MTYVNWIINFYATARKGAVSVAFVRSTVRPSIIIIIIIFIIIIFVY